MNGGKFKAPGDYLIRQLPQLFRDQGIHLDLDQKLGANETRHLDTGGCGIDALECFSVCASELFEARNVGDKRTSPNHIAQVGIQLLKRCLNALNARLGLAIEVSSTDDVASFVRRNCPGNDDGIPYSFGPAVRGFGFPGPTGIDILYHTLLIYYRRGRLQGPG